MNIKVEFVHSRKYFEKYYDDWLKRSNTQWLPWLGIGLIFIGILFYIFNDSNRLRAVPFVALIWGLIMFVQYYWNRKTWMKERMKSKMIGKELTLTFKEEEIEHKGPYSTGTVK